MGELLYCHEAIAAQPYYVEGVGMNLYSLEELCYYIAGNTYLLDVSFVNEELCGWLERELCAYKLARELKKLLLAAGRLSDFVRAILEYTRYHSEKQIQEIVGFVRQMEEMSDFACNKLRADRLMEKKRYLSSIYEYRRLLESEDAGEEDAHLVGNIWHNLGTAYTQLFLFEEALGCYERAYEMNQDPESLRESLLCCQCMGDEDGFVRRSIENKLDENEMQQMRNEFALVTGSERVAAFEERIAAIEAQSEGGAKNKARQAVSDMIFEWKEEYRESCRV